MHGTIWPSKMVIVWEVLIIFKMLIPLVLQVMLLSFTQRFSEQISIWFVENETFIEQIFCI